MNYVKIAWTGTFLTMLLVGTQVPAQKKSGLHQDKKLLAIIDRVLQQSAQQYNYLARQLPKDKFPRSFEKDQLLTSDLHAWTSGFYPGTLLLLFSNTRDSSLLQQATEKLELLEPIQYVTTTHDLGFMLYCSFGAAYRLRPNEPYKNILVQGARSLSTRFNANVGCIKSWDHVVSWDGKTLWTFPVIIDNMMNLELLFFAAQMTGDTSLKALAIRHAETTMKNHLRSDYSSYHVVNYDPGTGQVKSKETHQGFADNSTWARGQTWGIYGFTMVYRETHDKRFLQTAQKMADFYLSHLPADHIPFWDFNVNQLGYIPRWQYDPKQYPVIPKDASAAAIAASALLELSSYVDRHRSKKYVKAAAAMLTSLMSPAYRAAVGTNGGFLLKHGVGGFPSHAEVDVPLAYADYYFIEALLRYKMVQVNRK